MDFSNLSESKKKDLEDILEALKLLANSENDNDDNEQVTMGYDTTEGTDYYNLDEDDEDDELYDDDLVEDEPLVEQVTQEDINRVKVSFKNASGKKIVKFPKWYNNVEEFNKAVSEEDVANTFKSDESQDNDEINLKLLENMMKAFPRNKSMEKEYRKSASKSSTNNVAESKILYGRDKLNFGDKVVDFKRVGIKVDWGSQFKDDNRGFNLQMLTHQITNDICKYFGGWSRVRKIYVYDNQLIINDVCYMPKLMSDEVSKFPFDTIDYIKNGCLAPMFDWGKLSSMKNLSLLVFDDVGFVTSVVADGLGLGRKFGVSSLFRVCYNLIELYIGDDHVTREDLNKPESTEIKKSVAKSKRFNNILDGYHLDVYAGTQGLQNFTVDNLKSYAKNRGNKGLIHYTFGTLARAGLALGGAGLNLGAHLIGGTFKALKTVFKDAVTPVDEIE